jgi:hypothetical protein
LTALVLLAAGGVGLGVARLSLPGAADDTASTATPATRPVLPMPVPPLPVEDDTPVIGVTLGDQHRAYLLADLWWPDRHVLNDQVGEVPLSVTFCNLSNCVRAFTADTRGQPLDLASGGRHPHKARKMVLRVGGRTFEQETGEPLDGDTRRPFPYQPVAAVRTTWGQWRADHPKTELRANGQLYPATPP